MKTKIYVEGGGHKALDRECRRALGTFITRAGVAPGTVEIEACGSRGNAYRDFVRDANRRGSSATLLVDAEGPVTATSPWQHLQANDHWSRPSGATDTQCHLMVEVMESWFLADADTLEALYGQGFRRGALPQNAAIEKVPKQDVLNGLARATQGTSKGNYSKGAHSFKILEGLDPERVMDASPHAKRFIAAL